MQKKQQHPIIKDGTRILRPCEAKQLLEAIPKSENLDKFEALLFSGCRYQELKDLYKHPRWFHLNSIQIPTTKAKASYKSRYVRLNKNGERAIRYFLRCKKNLPTYAVWRCNLERWAKMAGMDPKGLNVKTTRKSWESWLVMKYQKQIELIFLSQGHSQLTALKYYLMVPFTKQDIEEMEYYTDGWL